MIATLVLATALITAGAMSAAPARASEDVPVPGGLLALARALEIERIDPATAVADLTRLLVAGDNAERVRAHLASVRVAAPADSAIDMVPMPLSAALWGEAVFNRAIARNDLFAAVLSDRSAALLARGLTALDDETLAFLAARPALLRDLYERDAAVLAGFASQIRIHDNRMSLPGGERSIPVWEAAVGERSTNPEPFVRTLLTKHKGRLAYLYDTIGHLDPARQAFALGLWLDGGVRVQRFEVLVSAIASAFPEWNATKSPFARPQDDLLTLLARVRVEPNGAPSFAGRSLWAAVFPDGDSAGQSGVIDAAWLADTLLSKGFRDRSVLLNQFGFGQRVMADVDAAGQQDAIDAIRSVRTFRMLMLTLERIGIRRPALYAAMARHAERIAALGAVRQRHALAQFQGAIAVIARMRRAGSIDVPSADRLLTTLAALPIDSQGGYRGGVALWLQDRLLPAIGARSEQSARDALLDALAGAPARIASTTVTWEGRDYSLDVVASERARIARALDRNPGASIDAALDLHRSTQPGARSRSAASPAPERIDAALAEALLSIAYAIDWSDPQGLGHVIRGTAAARHDFGLEKRLAEARSRIPWEMPIQVFLAGQAWRVEGSILGLDLVLARLALRRVHAEPLTGAPTLNEVERDGFIASLGLMNIYELHDSTADEIAGAIERGRRRVATLSETGDTVNEVISEIRMDGWRARALRWTLARDPSRIAGLFSMSELLRLGGGRSADLDAWGMSSVALLGCICSRLPEAGVQSALMGRPQVGILSSAVADLHLRVVVALRELGLPAALAKTVLAGALREFLDRVRPVHHDDWLTMARAAQVVPIERIEDYVAAATAGGPLLPAALAQRNPRQ